MAIVNLTPHTVTVLHPAGDWVTEFPPSGTVARVAVSRQPVGLLAGYEDSNGDNYIPVSTTAYGTVEGLPEPAEGRLYIVSGLVAAACPQRGDLLQPDELVRDAAGAVIGCRGFARPAGAR